MKTLTVEKTFEKEGKTASRKGEYKRPENLNDCVTLLPEVKDEDGNVTDSPQSQIAKIVGDKFERDLSTKLYQEARLEVVGVDDTIDRLAARMVKDAEKVGRTVTLEQAKTMANSLLAG